MSNFFAVGKDINIMSNDERDLEVLRYSSGTDSTLEYYLKMAQKVESFWLIL